MMKKLILLLLILSGITLLADEKEAEETESYYTRILTIFDATQSREVIEKEMENETDWIRKSRLIQAFAATGIDDDYVIGKLEEMLFHTIPSSGVFCTSEKEMLSRQIVQVLVKSARDDVYLKMVEIASDDQFDFYTRSAALDGLCHGLLKHTEIDKRDLKDHLQKLSEDLLSSRQLEQVDKGILEIQTRRILSRLE